MILVGKLRGAVRRIDAADQARRYDAKQNREARAARAAIEAQHPEARPDAATLRRVEQYAGDVLGSTRFAPWLETYTAWRREFREGWIPDNYFGRVVLSALPGPGLRREFGTAKTLARRVLGGTDLLPDRASQVNGAWLDRDGQPIGEAEAVAAIFAEGDLAVVKFDGSSRGDDVMKVRRDGFQPAELARRGNFVAQSWIEQHPFFDQFTSESVATIRITTGKHEGRPAGFRAAYLRLGLAGNDVVVASRSLRVPILDAEGTLGAVAARRDWTSCTAHPDSGARFDGQRIPLFREAVEAVRDVHDRIPHVAHVGWDCAIDREGRIRLMEWNMNHADIKFTEAATGPHFKDLNWERFAPGVAGVGAKAGR